MLQEGALDPVLDQVPPRIDAYTHVKGLSTERISGSIARQLFSVQLEAQESIGRVHELRRPVRIVIDALDEGVAPREVEAMILRPMREFEAVRLIVRYPGFRTAHAAVRCGGSSGFGRPGVFRPSGYCRIRSMSADGNCPKKSTGRLQASRTREPRTGYSSAGRSFVLVCAYCREGAHDRKCSLYTRRSEKARIPNHSPRSAAGVRDRP